MTEPLTVKNNETGSTSILPVLIIGVLFFLFGFITWLNGALIPFLQIVCDLGEVEALFVAFCFYFAYVVMALPMASLLKITGYRYGMVCGLGLIAIGALLFIPAALSREFLVFLFAQFVVGSGLTILQTASNPYIVRLGPEQSAAARIAFMGILNKTAGVLAPLVFTALVLGDLSNISIASIAELSAEERELQVRSMANGLIEPYIWMAVSLVVLAMAFSKAPLPDISLDGGADVEPSSQLKNNSHILQFPQLVLGAITLFMYVGVEVIAGDSIGLFGSKLGLANATSLTSYVMAFMVIGYITGLALIPRIISQSQALMGSALLGMLFSVLCIFASNESTVISGILWAWMGIPALPDSVALVALLGFANAMVWPAVWPLALQGLGKFTAQGSAILIMGIAGGAILPLLYGVIAEASDSQSGYWLMLPCYLFILYFAVFGHKKRQW